MNHKITRDGMLAHAAVHNHRQFSPYLDVEEIRRMAESAKTEALSMARVVGEYIDRRREDPNAILRRSEDALAVLDRRGTSIDSDARTIDIDMSLRTSGGTFIERAPGELLHRATANRKARVELINDLKDLRRSFDREVGDRQREFEAELNRLTQRLIECVTWFALVNAAAYHYRTESWHEPIRREEHA